MIQLHRTIYCRSRSPGALIVRLGDGLRQWSHEAGILADGETVIEAAAFKGGVVVTPLEDLIRRSSEFLVIERVVTDKLAGDKWALTTIGSKYDWLGAAGKPLNRPWQSNGRWFCSEHNTAWHAAAGLLLFRPGTRGSGPNDTFASMVGVKEFT